MITFITKQPKILILKAKKRPPWKETRTYSRLNKLSQSMQGAVKADFTKGITKFKSKVKPEEIYHAWLSKDYARVYETIPWSDLPDDLEGYGASIGDVLEGVGEATVDLLPAPISDQLRWDTSNPAIRDYVDNRTGVLIQDITEDTQGYIASLISRSFDEALTPGRVAKMIRPAIGLGTRLATAHANYVDGLRKQGLPDSKIDRLSASYENRLLDYRASMIARTESSFARNAGQLSVWKAAANQGLIERQNSKKQWIVDGKPCEECMDLEDQGAIGLDEFWDGEDGPLDAPPAHPNCMCGMEMSFEEPEQGESGEEEESAGE